MVDFKKMAQERYERATPEERARIDAYREREARLDMTRRDIDAVFTRYASRKVPAPGQAGTKVDYEAYPAECWVSPVSVRIEERTDRTGREYEAIRFIGGSTGHEAFELNDEFAEIVKDTSAEFNVCCGSVGYHGCVILAVDLLSYIEEMRPTLAVRTPLVSAP